MTDLIMDTIKPFANVEPDDDSFDTDLFFHINGVFMVLAQIGVGPKEPFYLDSTNVDTATWSDFLGEDMKLYNLVQPYMGGKIRLVFDPPTASSALEALKAVVAEYEWRLCLAAETN